VTFTLCPAGYTGWIDEPSMIVEIGPVAEVADMRRRVTTSRYGW
jgi:hypothetical protein